MKLKKLLSLLPAKIRQSLLRRKLRIPPISEQPYRFQIASAEEDLEAAYKLVHDSYVSTELMDPTPSGLRCSIFNAIPYTTVIVAKEGDRVIGTVSLIKDSSFGLPSDAQYKTANDGYRKRGHQLLEVSGLAVHESFRKKQHIITMNMMKYLYQYGEKNMKCDGIVIAIRATAEDFYAGLLGYERTGSIGSCGYVKCARAVHMFNSLRTEDRERHKKRYPSDSIDRNLISFTQAAPSKEFIFPPISVFSINPVLTPEMLQYFFHTRTPVLADLAPSQRAAVYSAYKKLPGTEVRSFRYPLQTNAIIDIGGNILMARVHDISEKGMFLALDRPLPLGQSGRVTVRLDTISFTSDCVLRWRNDEQQGVLPKGYGLEFSSRSKEMAEELTLKLNEELRNVHHQIPSKRSGTKPSPTMLYELRQETG